jgi:hypothetical protein
LTRDLFGILGNKKLKIEDIEEQIENKGKEQYKMD